MGLRVEPVRGVPQGSLRDDLSIHALVRAQGEPSDGGRGAFLDAAASRKRPEGRRRRGSGSPQRAFVEDARRVAPLVARTPGRGERREGRRLIDARFAIIKRLDDFRFEDTGRSRRRRSRRSWGSGIADREGRDSDSVNRELQEATGDRALRLRLDQERRMRFTDAPRLPNELRTPSRGTSSLVVSRYARTELAAHDQLKSLIVTTILPFGDSSKVFSASVQLLRPRAYAEQIRPEAPLPPRGAHAGGHSNRQQQATAATAPLTPASTLAEGRDASRVNVGRAGLRPLRFGHGPCRWPYRSAHRRSS
jgi:hypothetical protein